MMTGLTASKTSLRSRWTKPVWSLHGWLGLFLSIPLLVISVTGALLVRYDWVERTFDRAVFRTSPTTHGADLVSVIQRLSSQHPDVQVRFLERPGDADRNLVFSVHGSELRRSVIADAVNGNVLLDRDELTGPRRWLLRLHDSLLMGMPGELVVAVCSFGLLGLASSGLWIYRGALRGLFRLPRLRGRNARVAAGEGHRWLGITSLLLLFIWALTGAWFTLPSLLSVFASEHRSTPTKVRYDWASAPAIEPMLAEARRAFPESELDFLSLPREPGEPFTLTLLNRDRWFWNKLVEVTFDGKSGQLLQTHRSADGPWLSKLNLVMAVLHFGHLGGAVMRWVWLVLGFAPAFLAGTGVLIWWNRRRR